MNSREEALRGLMQYNEWRMGDETLDMPEPSDITRWIGEAIHILQQPDQIITDNSNVNYNALARIKELEANQPEEVGIHKLVDRVCRKIIHNPKYINALRGLSDRGTAGVCKVLSDLYLNGVIVKEK